jgi:uncharacterized protein
MARNRLFPFPLTIAVTLSVLGLSASAFAQQPDGAAPTPAGPSRGVKDATRTGNFSKAAQLLIPKAESGDAEAQYELAALYRTGRGVPQDDAVAFRWMESAARLGHAKAQFNLGSMYLSGRGVKPDQAKGRAWLEKASARGHEQAKKLLAESATVKSAPQAPSTWAATTQQAAPKVPVRVVVAGAMSRSLVTETRPPVIDAAWRGQTDVVENLVVTGVQLEAKDDEGSTALALASEQGHVKVVDVLLAAGANVNAANKDGATPLMRAAAKGHANVIDRLASKGANINLKNAKGLSALALSVRECQTAATLSLLKVRADIAVASEGGSLLTSASSHCDDKMIEVLLSQPTLPDGVDTHGRTALWFAADRGDLRSTALLLRKGADANFADKESETPLLRALSASRADVAELLIASIKMVDQPTSAGNTPLMMAAKAGLVGPVKALIERGASINLRNAYGYTALMVAASEGHAEAVTVLIDAGADRTLRNKKKENAQEIAQSLGYTAIAATLQ